MFPPPTCTAPVEFEALLPPVPPTDTGAETDPPPAGVLPVTDASTDVFPAWTVPTDPPALLSARAVSATPSAPAANSAKRIKSLQRMIHLLLRSGRGDRFPQRLFVVSFFGSGVAARRRTQTSAAGNHSFE